MSNPKAMKSGNAALKLRKGAWDFEEDSLLRKCIDKYGEGKWHLVPGELAAGKQVKYNSKNLIKQIPQFKYTKLRWSLISGRLPGRTANDVKNYWNTNIQKKLTTASSYQKEVVRREQEPFQRKTDSHIATTSTGPTATAAVIKPLPRTLSKGTTLISCHNLNPKKRVSFVLNDDAQHDNNNNNNNNRMPSSPATLAPDDKGIDDMEWWKNLFAGIDIDRQEQVSSEGMLLASSSGIENLDADRGLIWKTDESTAAAAMELPEDGLSDIWDLLNSSDDHIQFSQL